MTPQDVLNKTADLFEKKGWCQETYALDANGRIIDPESPHAACFCLIGGMMHVALRQDRGAYWEARQLLEKYLGANSPTSAWNDARYRTKAQVIEALRGAAAAQPQPEKTT